MKLTICTLDDYIPFEQSNDNISGDQQTFQDDRNSKIMDSMGAIAPNIIYLVGNNSYLFNEATMMLIGKETNNGSQNAFPYSRPCIFAEYEPICEPMRSNFMATLGCTWNGPNPGLMRLNNLKEDSSFFGNLLHAHDNLDARNRYLGTLFNELATNSSDESALLSDHVC